MQQKYDPHAVERDAQRDWEAGGAFRARLLSQDRRNDWTLLLACGMRLSRK